MMNSNLIQALKDITVAAVNNPEFFKGLSKDEQIEQITKTMEAVYKTLSETK